MNIEPSSIFRSHPEANPLKQHLFQAETLLQEISVRLGWMGAYERGAGQTIDYTKEGLACEIMTGPQTFEKGILRIQLSFEPEPAEEIVPSASPETPRRRAVSNDINS